MSDKKQIEPHLFEQLLSGINQESVSTSRKLEILYRSRGDFTPLQVSRILYAYAIPTDKIKAMEIMESRLIPMTSNEARDILGAMTFPNDKIRALQCIKRAIVDIATLESLDIILSAFTFESHKQAAMRILGSVRSDCHDQLAAGGHQMYSALGSVYSQARPMDAHLYGALDKQMLKNPGNGKIELPVTYKVGEIPSMYSGHPSYAYPQGRSYATDRQMQGQTYDPTGYGTYTECPVKPAKTQFYPTGAPLILQHQGAPAPTGFQNISQF